MHPPHRAVIDTGALTGNVRALAARTSAEVMAIVKADGYGHGAVRSAHAAVAGGASRLGVAQVSEALALIEDLPDVPLFAWIFAPGMDLAPAVDAGIELSAGEPWAVAALSEAARAAGRPARVHLAFDSGMAREGARPEVWEDLVGEALAAPGIEVVGLWSHLARADEPGVETTARQTELFAEAVDVARRAGADPEMVHLANSAGLLWHPETHFDLVRPGIAMYGLAPDGSDPAALGLTPVMRLEAPLSAVRRVPAGTPVSYGGTATVGPTVLGTVPLGYADGIPRQASSNGAWVSVGGHRAPVVGRICMDQFVVDLGQDSDASAGEVAVVFGAGEGAPTADDWARAAGTINYTITTTLGARVPRVAEDLGARVPRMAEDLGARVPRVAP
ncbi:MAG: alanine racemase [bacterium]|nr:alanine racemase [bacterium]